MSEKDTRRERIDDVIRRLLAAEDYLKIEDMADEMFVSRMTLDRLIPIVRQRVESFGMQLTTRPKYGIKIEGSERGRRSLMLMYGAKTDMTDYEGVRDKVRDVILHNGLRISDANLQNLLAHIALMLDRLQQGKPILSLPQSLEGRNLPRETAACIQICDMLEKRYGLAIPETDRAYLLVHLMVKCTADDAEELQPDMLELADAIIADVDQSMHSDFGEDEELRTALALHLRPLVYRLMYQLLQKNPILDMVRSEMSGAFELAQHAGPIIYERYGQMISEDETAYIALHFAVAMERREKRNARRRVVLLQNSVRGAVAVLQWTIQKACGYQAEDFVHCSSWELGTINWDGVDCIVTFVPLTEHYPVPVVLFTKEREEEALSEIRRIHKLNERMLKRGEMRADEALLFTDQSFATKEQALTFLCGKVKEAYGIDLLTQVMKRETLASTELGNGLAVPHPYAYEYNHPILAGMTLKKELFWKYDHVRMVLLIATPYGQQYYDFIGDMVGDLATDSKLMKRLLRSFDAESINELIAEYRAKRSD